MLRLSLILLTILYIGAFAQKSQGTLTVEITGFENDNGTARILIFNNAKYFPEDDKHAYDKKVTKIKNNKATFTFENIPYGTYAIAVLHDENDNMKMDYNFLGVPKEDYGFSNNARAVLKAPSFEDCSFTVNSAYKKITIEVD